MKNVITRIKKGLEIQLEYKPDYNTYLDLGLFILLIFNVLGVALIMTIFIEFKVGAELLRAVAVFILPYPIALYFVGKTALKSNHTNYTIKE